MHRLGNSKYWPFPMYYPMSRVSIGFSCTVSEIQNTGHSRRLARGKSYEHGFTKKRDGQKLCAKVEFRSVLCAPSRKFKILANSDVLVHVVRIVEFRLVFHALSRKFKILAIPYVLAHGMSYEHGFVKKRGGHKLGAKSHSESSFDRFFMHRLFSPWEVIRARFREKMRRS
ncbi:hypothetical protein GW17_00051755 [Ensete ventricosum]|nr:hypothetical protein GW17_00051755 [Ensete ventricosum]